MHDIMYIPKYGCAGSIHMGDISIGIPISEASLHSDNAASSSHVFGVGYSLVCKFT